jgi:PKD repeat protein
MELKFRLLIFCSIFFLGKAFAQPPYCNEPAILSACGSIEARGGLSPNRGCDSVIATFTNSSTGDIDSTYYCWGDGQTDRFAGVVPATHIFRKGTFCDTTYKVRMTIVKNCPLGKSVHSMLTYVTVQRRPTVAVWTNLFDVEANTQVTFTNGSSAAILLGNGAPCQTASCVWEFGDGDTLTVPCRNTQNHTYTVAGEYEVRLTVIHECATVSSSLRGGGGRLNVFYRPVIDLKIDSIVCANTPVVVTNRSKYVKSYQWSVVSAPVGGMVTFSDSARQSNPTINFSKEGTYILKTILTSFYGVNFTWLRTVIVKIPPQVTLASVPDACDSLTVTPRNLVRYSGGAPDTILWSFSNRTPNTAIVAYPPPMIYTHGIYNIAVKVTNYCGFAEDLVPFRVSAPPTASFTTTLDSICIPTKARIVSTVRDVTDYSWSVTPNFNTLFTDGTQSNSADPIIQFNQVGTYIVQGTYRGCRNLVKSDTIQVLTKPTAALTPIPDNCGSVTLSPTLTSTGGNQYSWTFEGGTPATSTLQQPNNILFGNAGMNRILVSVSNQCGTTADTTQFNLRDVVRAQCSNDTFVCNTSNPITLTAIPLGGTWTGLNLTNSTYYPNSSQIRTDTLIYTVGERQCITRDTLLIRLSGTQVNAVPNVSFCANERPTQLTGNTPIGGQWTTLGVSCVSPTGVFDPNVGVGTYPIRYTFTNSENCSNEATRFVTVKPVPTAVFAPIGVQCIGRSVSFTNQSTNYRSVRWDFGGLGNAFVPNPSFVFNAAGQYRVKLTAIHDNLCSSDTTQIVSVMQRGRAAFSPSADTIVSCGPEVKVRFHNESLGDRLTYLWDFPITPRREDTTRNVLDSILFQQSNSGIRVYEVRLMVTNLCGTDTAIHYVRVEPKPTANFTLIPLNDCSPMKANFLHVSEGYPTSFFWNLGNGRTSTDATIPQQTYYAESDSVGKRYEIKLIVGNSCGVDSVTRFLNVAPPSVRAFFQMDTAIGCAPLTVHCTNFSTPDSRPRWKVLKNGQEIVATTRHFNQTFTDAGNYTIILYASNANGCGYDSTTRSIQVLTGRAPTIAFQPAVCAMDTLKVRTTDSISTVQSIRWTFGDSNAPPSDIPMHCYERAGRYLVTLHGNSVFGNCPIAQSGYVEVRALPTAAFVANKTEGCPPLNVQLTNTSRVGTAQSQLYSAWDFGNRNGSNVLHPNQVYDFTGRYTIKLRVTDNYGCSDDSIFHPVIVYPKPTAHFTTPNHKICGLPTTITFSNQTIGAVNYQWNFGSNLTEPNYTYNVEGQQIIKLTASNTYLCSDTFTDTIQILKNPTAKGNFTPEWGCAPLRVRFQNQSQNANGKWFWRYGDETIDTVLTHLYTHAGKYSPKLVVYNGDFCVDSVTFTNGIEVLAKPVADFDWKDAVSPTSEKPNGILLFNNLSQSGKDFKWKFGDGGLSVLANPMHRYLQAKPHFVTLIATALNGCVDSVQKEVTPKFFSGLFVPNVMSVGASMDGMKHFLPKGTMLKTYQLSIYSTYGKLLWSSDKLEQGQPVEFWDGSLNGEPLAQDVYVWKIQATFEDGSVWRGMCDDAGRCSNVGTITILR